jgi:DNA topoisomerase-3
MKLYIAEKPSLARALADVLPGPLKKAEGYIQAANGDRVSWCIGHLLEQAEPEVYDARYKKWQIPDLPIIPEYWRLVAKTNTRKQLSVLKKLIREADVLVNVGDPDREGQLLVDEVINYANVSAEKRASALRCLISDLNPAGVRKALQDVRSNTEFIPLATSALARTRADWLYGINLTRLCTLLGQRNGFKGVLSIGRVQTPVLGLVVRRDQEIEAFTSKPFYELILDIQDADTVYQAKWCPSEACQAYMDDENRVLSRKLIENVASRVLNQQGHIEKLKHSKKQQAVPLPFNLSALQIEAARRFGLSAQQVLDSCQQLYERHKLITYPRSDCRYLPEAHWQEATHLCRAINTVLPDLQVLTEACDLRLKTKAWDDKKVGAHHAIIPTAKKMTAAQLTAVEHNLYELIARQYLMQFLGPYEYRQLDLETCVQGGIFVSQFKETLAAGWKRALLPVKALSEAAISAAPFPDKLKQGDQVCCIATHIQDKQTTAPKHFSDATLLAAMTGIARYVSDPEIRKILRETDGLGTEATRASIIELLFKRGFLLRKGKEIHASPVGRELIKKLPDSLSLPDMTAQWEAQLNAISQRELSYALFMNPMLARLTQLVEDVARVQFEALQGQGMQSRKKRRFKSQKKVADKRKATA